MRVLVLTALAALIGGSAAAAEKADCGRDATQTELTACADAEYKAADTKLNKTYSEIVRRLGDDREDIDRLKVAQRAWIAFRDAECAFALGPDDSGTIYPMVKADCLEKITAQRADQLHDYLSCQEGDLGCPVPPR